MAAEPSLKKKKGESGAPSAAPTRVAIPYHFADAAEQKYVDVVAQKYKATPIAGTYVQPPLERDAKNSEVIVSIPEAYMKFKPTVEYVTNSATIYLNMQDDAFYELPASLPNPSITVWFLAKHKSYSYYDGKYAKRRMMEEALHHNIKLLILNVFDFEVRASSDLESSLTFKGKKLPLPDCVLTRLGASVESHGLAVLRQLEILGVRVLNGYETLQIARDKMYTYQLLAGAGIPVPPSRLGTFPTPSASDLKEEFGLPLIIKQTSGTRGEQVWKCDNEEEISTVLREQETLREKLPYLIQKFAASSHGRDLRILITGNKVIASMMRISSGGFKANIHQGATSKAVELGPELEKMVLKIASLCKLDIVGVDLLLDDCYRVCEVNTSPGFEGLEKASGVNVGATFMKFMKDEVSKTAKRSAPQPKIFNVPIQASHK